MQRQVLIPLIVSTSLLMQNIDSTALVTALPMIAQSLNEQPVRLHMVLTAYMLSFAAFLPLSGWLADRYGPKQIFRASIALFTLASILCGFAQTYPQLVLLRVLQGVGGAMMVPVGRIILVRSVTKAELVSAMALMGMPSIVGPVVIGPLFGGAIAQMSSWRWIFWINVPIGIVGIFLVEKYIEDVKTQARSAFDWRGLLLLGYGVGAMVFGMDLMAQEPGATALLFLATGALAIIFYISHARRAEEPILQLALLRVRTFSSTVFAGSLFRIGVGANPFLLPLMLQTGFGYTPIHSGVVTCMSAVGAFGMRTMAQRVLRRFGFRSVLVWNGAISAVFLAICGFFQPDTAQTWMIALVFLGGVSRSLQFTALNAFAYADVEEKDMSHATTLQQMAQRISMSLGIALAAVILHLYVSVNGQVPIHAFAKAFFVIGFLCLVPSLSFATLPHDAGEALASRKKR